MSTGYRNVVGWLLSLFLGYEFAVSGIAKLTTKPRMVAAFHTFGYPLWFMYLTGCIELISVVLVLFPRTAVLGAGVLVCVMIGALFSHLTHGEVEAIRMPVILLLAALALAWVRSPGGRMQLAR